MAGSTTGGFEPSTPPRNRASLSMAIKPEAQAVECVPIPSSETSTKRSINSAMVESSGVGPLMDCVNLGTKNQPIRLNPTSASASDAIRERIRRFIIVAPARKIVFAQFWARPRKNAMLHWTTDNGITRFSSGRLTRPPRPVPGASPVPWPPLAPRRSAHRGHTRYRAPCWRSECRRALRVRTKSSPELPALDEFASAGRAAMVRARRL